MKNIWFMILLATSIGNGCGTDNGSNGQNASTDDTNTVKADESQDEPSSFYFELKKDLKPCSDKLQDALAYVKAEKKFYSCDGQEWSEVQMDLPEGKAGTNGKDAVQLAANQWQDPVTGIMWMVAGSAIGSTFTNYCADPYRLGNASEVIKAFEDGLQYKFEDLNMHTYQAWSDPSVNNSNTVKYSSTSGFYDTQTSLTSTTSMPVVCRLK